MGSVGKGSPWKELCMTLIVVRIIINNYSSFFSNNCFRVTSSKVLARAPRTVGSLPVSCWTAQSLCGGNGDELPWGDVKSFANHYTSTCWWSQESSSSFLTHSTHQPPMHSALSTCPRWDPSRPREHDNLASRDMDLPPGQLLL